MPKSKYVVYQDGTGEWRWCFVSNNHRIMAESSEAYSSSAACRIALTIYREEASGADVEDKRKEGRPRERSRRSKEK